MARVGGSSGVLGAAFRGARQCWARLLWEIQGLVYLGRETELLGPPAAKDILGF